MSASPTCVIEFVDGQTTRMPASPDVRRGIKLAQHTYRSRAGREPSAIRRLHFETDGVELLPLTPEEIAARRCGEMTGRTRVMAEHELAVPTESEEWYTPPSIFKALDLTYDLDPCSPGPGHWVPAKKIYTKVDDGLRQQWSGLIWLNPPFGGRRGQVPWLRKFFAHGNGIALVAARTSADWFHEVVVPHAQLLLFPNGKTKFIRADGSVGKEPGTGVVLIGAGSIACEALLRSGLGACMTIVARPVSAQQSLFDQLRADGKAATARSSL